MLNELNRQLRGREFTLVAVDGFAGAGKSTFTARLGNWLDKRVQVISADELVGPEQRDWRRWTPRQGYERYLDHRQLERDVLQPLRAGRPARYQRYDWGSRKPGESVVVEPAGAVVIEGAFLLRRRLRGYWDASIWIDAPAPVRERRLRARGETDAGWIERWMAAEDYYDRVDQPRQHADYIITESSAPRIRSGTIGGET